MTYYSDILKDIKKQGNFRTIPKGGSTGYVDFSTNDYMGLGEHVPCPAIADMMPVLAWYPLLNNNMSRR